MASAIPLATYRVQFTKDFTFDDAALLAPYLKRLGITHLYASPFLMARAGSAHGYDVVDHDRLNPELGGEQGFTRLSEALKRNDLGLILDFVPNHMGVGHSDNAWWLDVLEWGPKSPYAASFDIDWEALPHRRRPGVLLPILGRPYGEALQSGEISLKYDAASGSFAAWYFDHKLPINPQRYDELIRTLVAATGAADQAPGRELLKVADDYRSPQSPSYAVAPNLKHRLSQIEGAADIIERGLSTSYDGSEIGTANLNRLLDRQYFRPAYWRVAFSSVNYRRFFDINDLAGLRVEDIGTFRAVHSLIARLIAANELHGLRLDHIDGLRDPAQYCRRLTQLVRTLQRRRHGTRTFYVVVEKILADNEPMPRFSGVSGTTGYEWLNLMSRLLVDGKGLDALERTWRDFTGETASFPAMLETAKLRVIETMLASEFSVLAGALARIAAGHFSSRDYTANRLRAALQAYAIEFPVYRTYLTATTASLNDVALIDDTIGRARSRWQGPDPDIFNFLRDAITLDLTRQPGYSAPRVRDFALKLQQFTGPLMAKALEDTTFYRYFRLLALNEVGGDPAAPTISRADFHDRLQRRATEFPFGLAATATHDTKRGEDARARILALSELADDWNSAVRGWREQNAHLTKQARNRRRPSADHEYMLYQALIGAWPDELDANFVKRMQAYALKAAREGKQTTSWTNPDEDYENALHEFVGALLDRNQSRDFLSSFEIFAARTATLGALNGLSQLALKTLPPGVPDFYQGTEFWDLSLVDPDNRCRVDFHARERQLSSGSPDWADLAAHWRDGRIKFALTKRLLELRGEFAELFQHGAYEPLTVAGVHSDHVVAFARTWRRQKILVAIGRHFAPLTGGGRHWPAGRKDSFDARIDAPDAAYVDLLAPGSPTANDGFSLGRSFLTVPVAVMLRA